MARTIAIALLAATCLGLSGCRKMAVVHLLVPDFSGDQIGGVWFWRQGPSGFERRVQFVFQGVSEQGGVQVLQYTIRAPGVSPNPWGGPIEEDPVIADAYHVRLPLPVDDAPALWRATSWNAYGESELSAEVRAY